MCGYSMIETINISVIMPVFNAESYLCEAIESILRQTYKDFEFIIVNDGSTDNSKSIIEEYSKKDSRIVCINNDNKGISLSLNDGILQAKGKYIARMDADDISHADRLKKQFTYMEAHPHVGVCGAWAKLFGDVKKKKVKKHPVDHNKLVAKLLFSVCFIHPTVMMRKELLLSTNNLYDPTFTSAQDYDLWERLYKHTTFSNIPEVLLDYRVSKSSVSAKANREKNNDRFNLITSVNLRLLNRMGLNPSNSELDMHYMLGLNERIKTSKVPIVSVKKYLKRVYESNKKMGFLNVNYFHFFLSERFFAFCMLQKNSQIFIRQFIFSMMFVSGMLFYGCNLVGFI